MTGLVLGAFAASPGPASAQAVQRARPYVPGELIVRYRPGTRGVAEALSRAGTARRLPGGAMRLRVAGRGSVHEALDRFRRDPDVAYAVRNPTARASGFYPNDPGFALQWNLAGPYGINMPDAWALASARSAPGGRGVVVAVLDTGVAYRARGRLRRAPDLHSFVRGYDFVDDDPYPLDLNGHGTHVAGTIAEATNNGIGAAGVAYGARIMPVRTLDASGDGDAVTVTRGIRYAVRHGADVINLSLEFPPSVGAAQLPELLAAIEDARAHGVVITTVAGNEGTSADLPFPGRSSGVIAVAATTSHGCKGSYSNTGPEVDVAAPGGGPDAALADDPWDVAHCRPGGAGRSIYQQTLEPGLLRFALPAGYYGTSMAAPHVAGLAALIIASGKLGPHPAPVAVQQLIEQTARDIGPAGYDARYGYGLVDAAAALR